MPPARGIRSCRGWEEGSECAYGCVCLLVRQVFHPCAKMLVELSKSQDIEAGDGTTSVVVIAGSLLNACTALLQKGIHPTIIADSFKAAADQAEEVRDAALLEHGTRSNPSSCCSGCCWLCCADFEGHVSARGPAQPRDADRCRRDLPLLQGTTRQPAPQLLLLLELQRSGIGRAPTAHVCCVLLWSDRWCLKTRTSWRPWRWTRC